MRARISIGFTSAALAALIFTLGACASPASDPIDEIIERVADAVPDAPAEVLEDSTGSSTEGLSREAIDSGHTIAELPGGWPDELPLPDGHPVSAIRMGTNFSMIFDVASIRAGEEVFTWYESNAWSTETDVEMDGVRVVTYASPETNDYGPLRRVTVGLGMTDWPTGFQYSLEVQE